MPQTKKECDKYIIDTYKNAETGMYHPGAITYAGRKKLETLQWKEHPFATQSEADAFVREHFQTMNVVEASNEGELRPA